MTAGQRASFGAAFAVAGAAALGLLALALLPRARGAGSPAAPAGV